MTSTSKKKSANNSVGSFQQSTNAPPQPQQLNVQYPTDAYSQMSYVGTPNHTRPLNVVPSAATNGVSQYYQGREAGVPYANVQQQNFYAAASPYQMVPPTPFDPAYGASLLPSHLLMGSPFVSTPSLPQSRDYSQTPIYGRKSLSRKGTNSHLNLVSAGSNRSGYFAPLSSHGSYHNFNTANRIQFARLNDRIYEDISASRFVNSESRDRLASLAPSRSNLDINDLQGHPFRISYKILPKGDDAFRTRSLLFENIDSSVHIHTLIEQFVDHGPIESVFRARSDQDATTHNILLSFVSRETCLDYYNHVLRRLKEFKDEIGSPDLSLSFVLLTYLNDDETNNEDYNGNEYDGLDRVATRSIMIEMKKYDKENFLNDKLNFLENKSKNKRYVLESIDFVETDKAINTLPEKYVVLTFLNIRMAYEIMNYLSSHVRKLGIAKLQYLSLPLINNSSPEPTSKRSSIVTFPDNSTDFVNGNGSVVSIISSNSSSNHDLVDLIERVADMETPEYVITIDANTCPKENVGEHTEHLLKFAPFQPLCNDHVPYTTQAPHDHLSSDPLVVSQGSPAINPNRIDSFGGNADLGYGPPVNGQISIGPSQKSFDHISYPLGQYSTNPGGQIYEQGYLPAADIAPNMNAESGNRTVYIGNINPRSKVEDICNVVRGGILQNVKFIESKHICFVTFIEASAAMQFYANGFVDPIVLHGNTLKIGWGNYAGPLPKSIALAVTIGGNRNVYVSLPEYSFKEKYANDPKYKEFRGKYKLPSRSVLKEDFSSYGPIEQINYLSDSHCCWVNFLNITSAIKLVEETKKNDGKNFARKFNGRYEGLIINYGKDRCGNINKNLVASKGSGSHKKVKKHNFDTRLNKLEERREQIDAKTNKEKEHYDQLLELNSLGISIDRETEDNRDPIGEHPDDKREFGSTEADEARCALTLELYNESNAPNNSTKVNSDLNRSKQTPSNEERIAFTDDADGGLGLTIASKSKNESHTSLQEDKVEDAYLSQSSVNSSEASSDVELILNSPTELSKNPEMHKDICFSDDSRMVSRTSLDALPSKAVTSQRTHRNSQRKQQKSSLEGNETFLKSSATNKSAQNPRDDDHVVDRHRQGSQRMTQKTSQHGNFAHSYRPDSRSHEAKPIPGSEVMAQYLAQLQHSTFMYAANILGASTEEEDFYDLP